MWDFLYGKREYSVKIFPDLGEFCYSTYTNPLEKEYKLSVARFPYPLQANHADNFKISQFNRPKNNKNPLNFVKLNNISMVGWIPTSPVQNLPI